MNALSALLARGVEWLRLVLETIGAVLIALGAIKTIARLVRRIRYAPGSSSSSDRLVLARALVWALEFQLAADILETALAPDWQRIGQLAAIAAIRTGLNLSLEHDIEADRQRVERSRSASPADAS